MGIEALLERNWPISAHLQVSVLHIFCMDCSKLELSVNSHASKACQQKQAPSRSKSNRYADAVSISKLFLGLKLCRLSCLQH